MSKSAHRNDALLWSVVNNDEPAAYLFGTMHVRDRSAFHLVDRVLPYLETCAVYAAEMDFRQVNPLEMLEVAQLPEERDLRSYFQTRQYEKLSSMLMRSFGFDLALHKQQHPFLIIASISELLLRQDHLLSLDHYLWKEASAKGLERTGLESFEAQLQIMRSLNIRQHVQHLRSIGRNPSRFRRQVKGMAQSYEKQDIRGLYKKGKSQLRDLRGKLLYDRNEVMASRIEELLPKGRLFAAFGAGHLGGNKGVIALLKRRGWQVKPISQNFLEDGDEQ